MKIRIAIIHFSDRKCPLLCICQDNRCIPVAVLNHKYSEFLLKNILNGHNAIEVETEKTVDDLLGEWFDNE